MIALQNRDIEQNKNMGMLQPGMFRVNCPRRDQLNVKPTITGNDHDDARLGFLLLFYWKKLYTID